MSFSFSYFIALTTTSSTVLNSSGESRHPYLISNLGGKAFSLNTVECDVFIDALYQVEKVSFYFWFVESSCEMELDFCQTLFSIVVTLCFFFLCSTYILH